MLKKMMESKETHIMRGEDLGRRIFDEELPKNHPEIIDVIKKTLIHLNNQNVETIKKS